MTPLSTTSGCRWGTTRAIPQAESALERERAARSPSRQERPGLQKGGGMMVKVPPGWYLKGFYRDQQGRIRPILARIGK